MNKTAIKNFAVWARQKLISDVSYKMNMLGITEDAIAQPLPQSTKDLQFFDIGTKNYAEVSGDNIAKRNAIVSRLKAKERDMSNLKEAFQYVVEEVAYTWFNRLIAIRFMEVNGYLPSGIRVLSSENKSKNEPDFVTTPFDTDLEFTPYEQDRVVQLKDENKLDELFRMLFVKQCNRLHEVLPVMFEKTSDYTELLLSISFTDKDGIVYRLTHIDGITDADWQDQVQIIGWLYQYYNTELKDETFALLKKNVKITKERVPAATQLFTPDWIVRYMVENSLGRLWVEGHPNDDLKANWKYYLKEAEQEPAVQAQLAEIRKEYADLTPEDIKVIDPCMGSGHILVYLFDVLMQIYESQGYTQRDAAQLILEKNLYGLDIDNRASQLAYFAVMMKARQYDRRILTREIHPHVFSITESNGFNAAQLRYFGASLNEIEKNNAMTQAKALVEDLRDAKEYGSILSIEGYDWELLRRFAATVAVSGQMTLDSIGIDETQELFNKLIETGEVLSQKYLTCVTNPPYMASNNFNPRISAFIKESYPTAKEDLYSCFIERCISFCVSNAFVAMITMESWMFNTSFEKFRTKVLTEEMIRSLIHMPYLGKGGTSLGISFGTAAFVIQKAVNSRYRGYYNCIRFYETDEEGVPLSFPVANERTNIISQRQLFAFPGNTLSYWAKEHTIGIFEREESLSNNYGDARQGLKTSDNNRFLRRWYEVSFGKIGFGCRNAEDAVCSHKRWFPYNKGGKYRKWYGNDEYVIDWTDNGQLIKDAVCKKYPYLKGNYSFVVKNESKYFLEQVTWTTLTSGKLSFRYKPFGFLFDGTGSSIFNANEETLIYLLGLLNSSTGEYLIGLLGQTMSYEVGMIGKVPVIFTQNNVNALIRECIQICRDNWNMQEFSWEFHGFPMLRNSTVLDTIEKYILAVKDQRCRLMHLEEQVDSFYAGIYQLNQLEIQKADQIDAGYETIDVPSVDVVVKQLVSYAVGCMFGRYSLDIDGLAYAGGDWDSSKYTTFIPDADNCIPITDEAYFEDDIVGRFVEFIKVVYGEKTLEENLAFIANALGNKGTTSRDMICDYFLNDFMADHIKIHQKRPIYWLFDSGKQNGFKALCYMHRWNADTTGNMRVEYLHRMQRVYEKEIERMQDTIDNSRDSKEVSAASKRKEKLQKQLKETKEFDAKVAHLALSRIDLDLDDGVKVNYEKVQTAQDGKKMQILFKL